MSNTSQTPFRTKSQPPYNKKLTQVFDLKGSERNRMINVTQQQNQADKDIVLLDENFLRCK